MGKGGEERRRERSEISFQCGSWRAVHCFFFFFITLYLAVLSTGLLGDQDTGNAFLILLLNVSIK